MDNENSVLDIKKKLSSYADYIANKLDEVYCDISDLQLLLKETDNFESKAIIFLSNKEKNYQMMIKIYLYHLMTLKK